MNSTAVLQRSRRVLQKSSRAQLWSGVSTLPGTSWIDRHCLLNSRTIIGRYENSGRTNGFLLRRSLSSSPFDPDGDRRTPITTLSKKKRKKVFVPREAAVQLTEQARLFFKGLLEDPPRPEIVGILLRYHPSETTSEPRMVFSFSFVTKDDIDPDQDEGVSLEIVKDEKTASDGTVTTVQRPKSPAESKHDGLPKLYVSRDAFLKVLGATIDLYRGMPALFDREGNRLDPNF